MGLGRNLQALPPLCHPLCYPLCHPLCHLLMIMAGYSVTTQTLCCPKRCVLLLADGRYLNVWGEFPHSTHTSGSDTDSAPDDPNSFTAFKQTDLQNYTDLYAATGGKCTKPGSQHQALVETCATKTPTGQCCVDLSLQEIEVSFTLNTESVKIYTA